MNRRELRWYGWGYSDTTYSFANRPTAWPYLQTQLGLTAEVSAPVVSREAICLRPSRLDEALLGQLRQILGDDAVRIDDEVRLTHSLGKSYCDLIRLRSGQLPNPTDGVLFPSSEEQIVQILALATTNRLAVIPFGGGTSVVGGVEPLGERPVLTVSLARLKRVLAIDPLSQTVTAEAGIVGPALEQALNDKGLTLGHFPQSFQFSTLGGWVATRGAGHASTKYGKIEKLVISVRMVTPSGVIETRTTPADASGPSLLQLLVGSEGVYGIVTQATLRLNPLPQTTAESAFLFDSFTAGSTAVRTLMQQGLTPSLVRLSDETETRTSFALRQAHHGWGALKEQVGLRLIARAGKSFDQGAVLLLRFEGNANQVRIEYATAKAICKAAGAFALGGGPVRSWQRDRYQTPYLRDLLLDRGLLLDTVETATTWENLPTLYHHLTTTIQQAIAATGSKALVLTHLSHVYREGASLYVTLLAKARRGHELEQWQAIKSAATACIMAHGGALSHHHGIGYDHAAWLAQEQSQTGVAALMAVKQSLDPQGIMNPAKLFAPAS